MLLNNLRHIPLTKFTFSCAQQRLYLLGRIRGQAVKSQENKDTNTPEIPPNSEESVNEIFPTVQVVSMMMPKKEPVVLSFDDMPGPKSLKYLSNFRQYLTDIGTQVMASTLTFGLNIGTYLNTSKPLKNLSSLFDEYGPVVRFISPVGGDVVLINNPDHIQKVYAMEGDCPVRSTLDCLERYRTEHRNHIYGGLYTINGQEWTRQKTLVYNPLNNSVVKHLQSINDVCEGFTQKIYNSRNHQDEIPKDLYKEIHKWTFDCMGLIIFAKRFNMVDTELVYSQCDMSWLYHCLEKATEAIGKCESGMHLWKLFPTPAWHSLVKYCDNLDNLIGKHVMEAEQSLTFRARNEDDISGQSLISAMLLGEEKMSAEDIATILMDMLLIGVNTITSTMSFLLYFISRYQRTQKLLYQEIEKVCPNLTLDDGAKMKRDTPYLQACIKETLRLVPPIPVLTRILPKNITLDKYNIPRGTLIIMSTQDSSLKESNYDDATKFYPERWLKADAKDYHAFASIPFGYGARKCLGQNIAETMLSLLTIRLIQKYMLEYHYGDIQPTRSFIARPNKSLKLRFVDRN